MHHAIQKTGEETRFGNFVESGIVPAIVGGWGRGDCDGMRMAGVAGIKRHWRNLVARYGAYDHVFLWTVANEYETHPDGRYRLDYPADVDWARATARFIKAHDSGRHPVTVHPVVSSSRRGESPRAP